MLVLQPKSCLEEALEGPGLGHTSSPELPEEHTAELELTHRVRNSTGKPTCRPGQGPGMSRNEGGRKGRKISKGREFLPTRREAGCPARLSWSPH